MTLDMTLFLLGLSLFCLLLAGIGAAADWIDSTDHKDARRRNRRQHARRMR